jgi:RNA polymerase sigma factor (sigma-70 family)
MFSKVIKCELGELALGRSVASAQRWVLSAMQSHGQELVVMLWRILGNEEDVCDAYQDTFLRLAHYEGGIKPENVKAYLFRSASNVAISMLRSRISERRRLSAVGETEKVKSSPADDFDARALQENLRDCLARLPEHLRSVVLLRDMAELPYSQVGSILGLSPATARVYRCKAIQLLGLWMSKEEAL